MRSLREVLANDDVVLGLRHMAEAPETAFPRAELENQFDKIGVREPPALIDRLLDTGLMAPYGGRFGISSQGQRAHLLAEALDGGDLQDIVRRLRSLSGQPDMYELVREGMTTAFVRALIDRPGFRRLYICSPWINPSEKDVATLKYAYLSALKQQEDPPEIYVILRPPESAPQEAANGVDAFRDLGAQLFLNPKIHSKLYIREPDRRGGAPMAIVGSQNLTRSKHLELGIRINGDSRLIDKLIQYFLEIASRSSESDPVEE